MKKNKFVYTRDETEHVAQIGNKRYLNGKLVKNHTTNNLRAYYLLCKDLSFKEISKVKMNL